MPFVIKDKSYSSKLCPPTLTERVAARSCLLLELCLETANSFGFETSANFAKETPSICVMEHCNTQILGEFKTAALHCQLLFCLVGLALQYAQRLHILPGVHAARPFILRNAVGNFRHTTLTTQESKAPKST